MTLSAAEKDFIRVNKVVLEQLIDKRLADFKDASISAPTAEERERVRLLALEFQTYGGLIKSLFKKSRKKKEEDFTGV